MDQWRKLWFHIHLQDILNNVHDFHGFNPSSLQEEPQVDLETTVFSIQSQTSVTQITFRPEFLWLPKVLTDTKCQFLKYFYHSWRRLVVEICSRIHSIFTVQYSPVFCLNQRRVSRVLWPALVWRFPTGSFLITAGRKQGAHWFFRVILDSIDYSSDCYGVKSVYTCLTIEVSSVSKMFRENVRKYQSPLPLHYKTKPCAALTVADQAKTATEYQRRRKQRGNRDHGLFLPFSFYTIPIFCFSSSHPISHGRLFVAPYMQSSRWHTRGRSHIFAIFPSALASDVVMFCNLYIAPECNKDITRRCALCKNNVAFELPRFFPFRPDTIREAIFRWRSDVLE